MAGHSKWKQIKHKKTATDQKRARIFSKALNAISIAARNDSNPNTNPKLKAVIYRAKLNNVPKENIEKVINKASENKNLEELTLEAYGPEGSALIIEVITDNRNRTMQEIKKMLSDVDAKIANKGSVLWSFDPPTKNNPKWEPKFKQTISKDNKKRLSVLILSLEEQNDVQDVTTNVI